MNETERNLRFLLTFCRTRMEAADAIVEECKLEIGKAFASRSEEISMWFALAAGQALDALKGRYALRPQGELSRERVQEIADLIVGKCSHLLSDKYINSQLIVAGIIAQEFNYALSAPQLISNKTPKEPSND